MWWVINARPWPLYPRERPGTHCIWGWMGLSEPVWIGAENLASTGIWSSDHPARSESLYRLSYPGSPLNVVQLYFPVSFNIPTSKHVDGACGTEDGWIGIPSAVGRVTCFMYLREEKRIQGFWWGKPKGKRQVGSARICWYETRS